MTFVYKWIKLFFYYGHRSQKMVYLKDQEEVQLPFDLGGES